MYVWWSGTPSKTPGYSTSETRTQGNCFFLEFYFFRSFIFMFKFLSKLLLEFCSFFELFCLLEFINISTYFRFLVQSKTHSKKYFPKYIYFLSVALLT